MRIIYLLRIVWFFLFWDRFVTNIKVLLRLIFNQSVKLWQANDQVLERIVLETKTSFIEVYRPLLTYHFTQVIFDFSD